MKTTYALCGLAAALVCLLPACVQQHTTIVMPPETPAAAPAAATPAAPKKKMPVQPAAAKPAPAAKAPEPLKPLRGTYSQVITPGDGVKAKRSMGGEKVYAN